MTEDYIINVSSIEWTPILHSNSYETVGYAIDWGFSSNNLYYTAAFTFSTVSISNDEWNNLISNSYNIDLIFTQSYKDFKISEEIENKIEDIIDLVYSSNPRIKLNKEKKRIIVEGYLGEYEIKYSPTLSAYFNGSSLCVEEEKFKNRKNKLILPEPYKSIIKSSTVDLENEVAFLISMINLLLEDKYSEGPFSIKHQVETINMEGGNYTLEPTEEGIVVARRI